MLRTKDRPLPTKRMSVNVAMTIAILFTILGLSILYSINPKTALFGAISIFLYTCAYTPLKSVTPLTVFVGAIPGAIPFMLGWVAATNEFGIEAGMLFMIQFFWQFPHFWAIGWLQFEEYNKAGFSMLPMNKKDKGSSKTNNFLHCYYDSGFYSTSFKGYRRFLYLSSNSNNCCFVRSCNVVLCNFVA